MIAAATADPAEVARFDAMAADWWNPRGSSAMLHRLNPVRLGYIRARADAHWRLPERTRRPLEGRRALDVGCGGGLLAEPLARLGATVTAVDAAAEAIAVARAHAAGQRLAVDYRVGGIDAAAGERFDLVTCLEVIEHVPDLPAFLAGLAGALADGGLMILSTPNRTPLSRLAVVQLGETFGGIPPGTHDWSRFVTPEELAAELETAGLRVRDATGLAWSPARGFALSDDRSLNYLMAVTRSSSPARGES